MSGCVVGVEKIVLIFYNNIYMREMGNWSFVCVFLWFLLREFGLIVVNCLCGVRYKMIIFVYNFIIYI